MYRIGEFSTLCQVPVRTLRYYDAIGLLRPGRVERLTGYRYYAATQVERLNRILVYKDLGFSLREIRTLLADHVPIDQVRVMLRSKHDELERRVERERARLARAAACLALVERSGQRAAGEVAIREFRPRLVASLRTTVASHDASERLFEEIDFEIGADRSVRRPRGAIWHSCANGAIDCEAMVFVSSPRPARGRVTVYELPPMRVASLVYRGDDTFPAAYLAIRTWLSITGVDITGPKREIFLDEGGGDTLSLTEIQFPIAASPRASTDTLHPAGAVH
jgi:DNA-binding transcriptional MerR regulator